MNIENGEKEPIGPVSIEEPSYVYKRAEGYLHVTPEDDECYDKAATACIAAADKYQFDNVNALVIGRYTEKFWRNAYENLPEIPTGYVRLLHHTFSADQAEGIRQNGLKYDASLYGRHGDYSIRFTANIVRDMNEKNDKEVRELAFTRVETQKEGIVVVFDLSEADLAKYGYDGIPGGVIPAQFLVAVLPERTPIVWSDYETRTFMPLSQRFSRES